MTWMVYLKAWVKT